MFDVVAVKEKMETAARDAADKFLQEKLGGKDSYPCGFAWVNVVPKFKGNTRDGKAERIVLGALGFKASYENPRVYYIWNPSKNMAQNVDVKYAGAEAAARVLNEYGLDASSDQRWD